MEDMQMSEFIGGLLIGFTASALLYWFLFLWAIKSDKRHKLNEKFHDEQMDILRERMEIDREIAESLRELIAR
jgi:hypothetical protein